MKSSVITAEFESSPQTVWDIVTNNEDTAWRSDLDHVEVQEGKPTFVEISKGGVATEFTITEKEPCRRYAFTMRNQFFMGNWSGTFQPLENGGTKIAFEEKLKMHNPFLRLMSLFMNLKKMQQLYIDDLRKKLGESR